MSSDSVLIIAVLIASVLFIGEPDLLSVIKKRIACESEVVQEKLEKEKLSEAEYKLRQY